MKFNIHAGHNPDNKTSCGAIGLIKESTEARKVKDEVIKQLQSLGYTVYDCTCNNGISQKDVLKKIVSKCNLHKVDLDISIHFNSSVVKTANGTECLVYNTNGVAYEYANKIVKSISNLGYNNRGVKKRTDLYVLKNTKSPSLLIECCFVGNTNDTKRYDYKSMATAIVSGILGTKKSIAETQVMKNVYSNNEYSLVFNYEYYYNKYKDLQSAIGFNYDGLLNHFKNYGMKEGRQGISTFNVQIYKAYLLMSSMRYLLFRNVSAGY